MTTRGHATTGADRAPARPATGVEQERRPCRIAVVGGGIAGLALAAMLDPDRFDVTVHEARPERRGLGTALGMWPAARRALRRAGAGAALEHAVRVESGALRALDGRPFVDVAAAPDVRLASRTDVLDGLDRAVPDAVRRIDGRVDDPARLDADLVVGADGVHSVVRRAGWGERALARPTPWQAVRGLVPPRETDAVGEYWGRGRLFGITPVPGGVTNWFCAYPSDLSVRDVDVPAALDEARGRFAGAAPAVAAVLARARPETTLAQRIWTAPPLRSLVRGRAVLIGDAAHAMAPNLGRGAGESLIDAVVLADALHRLPLPDALRHYETRRLVPSQAVRVASSLVARIALADRLAPPRDRLLAAVGGQSSRSGQPV